MEIIENRIKQVGLKENKFEVFEPAVRDEIVDFMSILETIDPNFSVVDYLNSKKKFNLSGALLEYYKEVATTTYYCVTLMRHRNMSGDFLNSLYADLNVPFDLHPIPCPIKDPENPENISDLKIFTIQTV